MAEDKATPPAVITPSGLNGVTVSSTGVMTVPSTVVSGGNVLAGTNSYVGWSASKALFASPNNGAVNITDSGDTLGSRIKADALPTIASGFGGSAAITAGSTPFAGSIDIGTGGAATTGVINFAGTAFPSAPFVVVTTKLTNAVTRVSAISTTQLTLTSTTAWTANDIISWICVSAK